MSQHDFDIANQTAPNTRADLNLALKALASNSSGASAPTTTYANMIYYNTSTNILYKRNEADSAWISLGTVDESLGTFTPSGFVLASQAEAEAGTENTKVMTPLRVSQAISAAPLGSSATVTFACPTAASSSSGSHGLGVIPSLVHTYMTCTTADVGYSIGDVVSISNMSSSGTGVYGYTLELSTSNVIMRSAQSGFLIVSKTNSLSGITPARWQVTVKCFA